MWTLRLWVKRKMEMFHFNSFVTSITSSQGKFKNLKGHSNANLKGGWEVRGQMHKVHNVHCLQTFPLLLKCFVGLTETYDLSLWCHLPHLQHKCMRWVAAHRVQVSNPRPQADCMHTNFNLSQTPGVPLLHSIIEMHQLIHLNSTFRGLHKTGICKKTTSSSLRPPVCHCSIPGECETTEDNVVEVGILVQMSQKQSWKRVKIVW